MSSRQSNSPPMLNEAIPRSRVLGPEACPDLPGDGILNRPLVLITARKGWSAPNFGEVWRYRELLYFLTWRDIKVRYKQTALGVAWVIMQPLLTALVFTIFLGYLARVPSDDVPYSLFVFAGLLLWTFFATSVSGSSASLVGNANLITKVYFPRMIIPAASISARLLDLLISFAVLGALMAFYGIRPTAALLWLPPLTLLVALLALAVGMWASALNVKYRDVGAILPVLMQFWMFASPVVYPSSLLTSRGIPLVGRWLYSLNPMVGILDNFRAALLGRPFNWPGLAISAAFTITVLVYAVYDFRRMERKFADVV